MRKSFETSSKSQASHIRFDFLSRFLFAAQVGFFKRWRWPIIHLDFAVDKQQRCQRLVPTIVDKLPTIRIEVVSRCGAISLFVSHATSLSSRMLTETLRHPQQRFNGIRSTVKC